MIPFDQPLDISALMDDDSDPDVVVRPSWLPMPHARLGTAATGGWPAPSPRLFLDADSLEALPRWGGRFDGIVGHGAPERKGRAYAARHHLPYWTLAAGPFGRIELGGGTVFTCSLVADDLGIHRDAARPSRLERIFLEEPLPGLAADGAGIRERILRERLSRDNLLPDRDVRLPGRGRPRLLLVDEAVEDPAVRGGLAGPADFARMVETARRERPKAELLVWNPARPGAGMLAASARALGLNVIEDRVSPHAVLDAVDEVWTVASPLGFDALLRGLPVTAFGVPFYAGYGLTSDRPPDGPAALQALARRAPARLSADALAGGLLARYCLHVDPIHERRVSFAALADRLAACRRRHESLPERTVCVGFSRWKRPMARAFLGGPGKSVAFAPMGRALALARARGASLCAWGMKGRAELEEPARAAGVPLLRLEDGFLRSVGLGSNFVFPASLCLDRRSIYYDAARPSDLEHILATAEFPRPLVARARALREAIVAQAVTKYGMTPTPELQRRLADLRSRAGSRDIILIPGQVPGDASIVHGCPRTKTNFALLKAVRAERPDAFVIFKVHPDVVAGNRSAGRKAQRFEDFADAVVTDGPIIPFIDLAEEVHVMSSLAGFEALLRRKRVVTWGSPFFAGWGLTQDKLAHSRRGRSLWLDELVAGALILYPAYVHPPTLLPCEPEDIVTFLAARAVARRPRSRLSAPVVRGLEYLLRMAGMARRKF